MLQLTSPSLIFNKKKLFKTAVAVENSKTVGIEGKDAAETVLLFTSEAGELLKGEERTQLMKIVSACKLKEDDVVLVNASFAKNLSLAWLRKSFPVKTLIVFGDMEISKNLKLRKHYAYTIDGVQMLKSEPLQKLFKSDADKKALWMELKKVFGV
ncbi:MAG TPA: hypothetical protein VK154_10530 [Chitinophagales bacterium]|nr:hypothetical protein [Chitinophagales bacterium]